MGLLALVLWLVGGGVKAGGGVGGRWLDEALQGYRFCSWTVSGLNLKLDMGIFCRMARLDLFDGHFFGAMEWLMFFSRAPSALMVFQWFCQR